MGHSTELVQSQSWKHLGKTKCVFKKTCLCMQIQYPTYTFLVIVVLCKSSNSQLYGINPPPPQKKKKNDVTTDTTDVLVVAVSVVTILDNSEPNSKMLIGTWLPNTVLKSSTHIKAKCYGITPRKVCLIA